MAEMPASDPQAPALDAPIEQSRLTARELIDAVMDEIRLVGRADRVNVTIRNGVVERLEQTP